MFEEDSDYSDSEEELEDKVDEIDVNGVKDQNKGDKAPAENSDIDILLHVPIFPQPMVAQSS